MIFWIGFAVFVILFIFSVIKERRLFRNAIFLGLWLCFLFLALTELSNGTTLNLLFIGIFYGVIPLCLFLMSFVFISAGIISIKREGFRLSQSLSIIFGIGMLATLGTIVSLFIQFKLPTIILDLLLLVIIAAAYITFTFISLFIYSQLYKLLPKNLHCDFIIVHGAGLINGNKVSPLLAGRLDKGIEVYNSSNQQAKFIVSGGQGSDEKVSEAQAMEDYLLEKGIPKSSIVQENKSTTTFENMAFSKKIIDTFGEKLHTIFVTNDYHVFRTGTYAKKVGLAAEGVGCRTAFYYWPNAFIREYIAIIIHYKIVPIVIGILWLLVSITSLLPFNI